MSLFTNWLAQRELRELADQDLDNGRDYAVDHDKIQKDLLDLVIRKYPDETMAFIKDIADRGDEEVKSLYKKLTREKGGSPFKEPLHPTDGDEVVPPLSDQGKNPFGMAQ